MSEKISVDADGLAGLLAHALQSGTIDKWAVIAVEWAQGAEREIERLRRMLEIFQGRLPVEIIGCQIVKDGDTIRIEPAEAEKQHHA